MISWRLIMPVITVSLRNRILHQLPVRQVPIVIGRDPACDIRIDNPGISRWHARVDLVGRDLIIRDLGSANGMIFGGEAVRYRKLAHRDTIELGKFTLTYAADAGPPVEHVRYRELPDEAEPSADPARTMVIEAVPQAVPQAAPLRPVVVGSGSGSKALSSILIACIVLLIAVIVGLLLTR